MKEIIDFLAKSPAFYVATADEAGKPRARPFSFVMEWEGRLTFVTNTTKSVYKQLSKNPYIEICSYSPSNEWLRVSGSVEFFKSVDANRKVFEITPMLKDMYGDEFNDILICFYIKEGKAEFFSFERMGEPFKVIKL
jgi:uncharacterized pyridoxamine 5'-phosphate oxidase family protein